MSFTTTGSFTCVTCTGSGTSSVTYPGSGNNFLTLSFTGSSQTIALSPAGGGTFDGAGSAGTVSAKSFFVEVPITQPTTLQIAINQAAGVGITAGSGVLNSTLMGSVGGSGSTGTISFAPASVIIGNVEYTLLQPATGITITSPPASHIPGITQLPLHIVATELPEPTFLSLTAVCFAGLSVIAFRRRRRA